MSLSNDSLRKTALAITNYIPNWTDNSARKILISSVSLVSLVLLWHLGSVIVPNAFPAPRLVTEYALETVTTPGPRGNTGFDHLYASLRRVSIIGTISLTATLLIGVTMGLNRHVESVVSMWLPFWLTIPDIVAILFFMILMGFNEMSVIIVVAITVTPFGVVNVWEGIQDLDRGLVEMSQTFEVDSISTWRHIYIPHLLPYVFASSRYLLGQIWKVVLVGEAIALNTGIGAIIRLWFNQGETTPIFAFLMIFMIVVLGIEYGVLKPLERHFFRWRPD